MRNLKRALSLTLASVMLLGMMVVGSSAAAGYDDVKETDNVEAIEVLQTVGVMVGDERGFGPDRPVNRAEMAVVMGLLLNLDYNYYSATCPFNDVYDWARGWVGACAANGIVSGRGDGVYDPGATVTAVEAASMLMRALGYFKYASDYADGFEVSTVRQGTTIGIFKGVGSSAVEPMTRNQVAQMVLNTLRSGMVQPDGNTLNYFDNNGQVIATGGKINYVYVTSNDSFARSISRLEATSMGSPNGSPIVELGEQLYDGDLKLYGEGNSVADRVWDEFGRPARTWEYKGQEIGTYEKKELLKETYTAKVTGQTLYELLGKSTIDNYNFQIAIDGVYTNENNAVNTLRGAWFDEDDLYRNNKDAVGRTGNGVLTKVYVDTDFANPANYSVYIAIINTYLAKANEDYDSKNDDVSLRVWRLTNTSTATAPVYVKSNGDAPYTDYARTKDDFRDIDAKGEDFSIVKDVKKNDLYKVTVADGEIQTIEAPEILSAVTVDAFKLNDHVTTGGQQYDHATTARYDVEAIENWTGVAGELNLKELTYNVILDDYGYLLGLERNEDPNQYVFVTGIEATASNLYAKQLDANVIFLDGTMDTVKIDMTKSSWGQPGADDQSLAGNRDGINLSQLNTWCTYTVNSNGVYTMKRVAVSTGSNIVNQDTDDNIKIGQFAQDVALFNDGASEQANTWDTKSVNTKRVSLKGSAGNDYVYGNDDTVYLAVSLEKVRVDDITNVNVYDRDTKTYADDNLKDYRWIVDDVDTVVTGVKNASLKATDLGMAKEGFGYPNAEIYTLYDEDGIVIAAVMIGEDDGASSTYAYIHSSGLEEESYTSAAARADGEWTWTRKAIVNGAETLLKEVGDSPKYLSPNQVGDWGGMKQGQWYEIRYNADGNVRRAISVPLDGAQLKYPVEVSSVETSVNDSETVVLRDITTPTALSYSGGTLYTNTDKTKGFSVDPDVKTVLILADKNGKKFDSTTDGYNGYTGLEQALREVNYKATNHTVVAGELEVSAIFNGGRATTIIINDYTPAPNNRPGGGNKPSQPTESSVTVAEKVAIKPNGDTYGTMEINKFTKVPSLSFEFMAPEWAEVNAFGDVTVKYTMKVNGEVLDKDRTVTASSLKDKVYKATGNVSVLTSAINAGTVTENDKITVEITEVTWKYAGVKYYVTDGTTETAADTAITGANTDKMPVGESAKAAFSFTYTIPSGYEADGDLKASYSNMTATEASGQIAVTSGSPTNLTNAYTAGGDIVKIVIGKVKATESAEDYDVTVASTVKDTLEFAVMDAVPTAGTIPADSEWSSTNVTAKKDQYVLVRSAVDGVNLSGTHAAMWAPATPGTAAADATNVSTTSVYYFQMPEDDVIITSTTNDVIKGIHGYVADALDALHVQTDKTASGASNLQKANIAVAWLKSNGYPNAKVTYSNLAQTTVKGVQLTDGVEVLIANVKVGDATNDGYIYVKVDDKDVVAEGTKVAKTVAGVLGAVGITNNNSDLYVKVGTAGAASNATSAVTNNAVIDTNEGKGYVMLNTTAVAANATVSGSVGVTSAAFGNIVVTLKPITSAEGFTDSGKTYVKVGATLTVTLNPTNTATTGAKATTAVITAANTTVTGPYGTAAVVTGIPASTEWAHDGDPLVELTFQLTAPTGGATGSITVELDDVT